MPLDIQLATEEHRFNKKGKGISKGKDFFLCLYLYLYLLYIVSKNLWHKWREGMMDYLKNGIIAGGLWGLIAMGVNSITGIFSFEYSILHNLITFTVGGAIFGIVTGGILTLIHNRLPFKSSFGKAVLLTTCIWVVLEMGGLLLSSDNPMRYHPNVQQSIQGLLLAVLMGSVMGVLLQIQKKRSHC
ncbi:MAG: hypothetical protein AABZ28_05950 [Nitrospinota bacterium]